MGDTHRATGLHGENPGLLRMATSLAVIGSALGLLAALLLGGSPGVWPDAASRPAAPECGTGLIRLGGHHLLGGRRG
jgi:hypothetical protein